MLCKMKETSNVDKSYSVMFKALYNANSKNRRRAVSSGGWKIGGTRVKSLNRMKLSIALRENAAKRNGVT